VPTIVVVLVVGVGCWAGLRALGVRPVHITSGSMAPTIETGDWVVVGGAGAIERGDVVLFRFPLGTTGRAIKRVVAVAGDRVELTRSTLTVDGRTISLDGWPGEPRPGELVVPEGHVFLLGDNHAGSIDSRAFGMVPEGEIVGRVRTTIPEPRTLTLGVGAAAVAVAAASRRRRQPTPLSLQA
jgi:signal peptidase I